MKLLRRVLVGVVSLVLAVVLFLVGSVAVDGWRTRNRVGELVNTAIPNPAGQAIGAYVARPAAPAVDGRGWPAVIMLHEFWGLKPDLLGKADALAEEGYVVVAPDMFRGQTTTWLPRAIYQAVSIPEEQVLGDLAPVLAWVRQLPDVDPARIVIMGFCYGGGKALQFSLRHDQVAATAVFYGALESDPARLSRLPGPVLGIFGALDQAPSPEQVAAFELGLQAAGIEHEITIYDGVGHAFLTDMAAIRQGGTQGAAWAQFVTWLDRVVP
jgi:carboxymethylenebutenolidase